MQKEQIVHFDKVEGRTEKRQIVVHGEDKIVFRTYDYRDDTCPENSCMRPIEDEASFEEIVEAIRVVRHIRRVGIKIQL